MAELFLEVVEGPGAGARIELSGPVEVGREPGVGFVLADPEVSRRHVRLTPRPTDVVVEDLGSTNGTFLNDNPVTAPASARPGDEILVGVTVLRVRSSAEAAARSAVRAVPPPLAAPLRPYDYVPDQVAKGGPAIPELDPLLDIYTKSKARTAPIAMFALAVIAVLVFLALK